MKAVTLLLWAVLLATPFKAFSQMLEASCANCNPAVYSSAVQAAIDDVFLDPRNEGQINFGDRIRIVSVDALGENCIENCNAVGLWEVTSEGVQFDEIRYNDGGTGSNQPRLSGGGGGSFYPTIIPGNAGMWTFECKVGGTAVSCETGEPL